MTFQKIALATTVKITHTLLLASLFGTVGCAQAPAYLQEVSVPTNAPALAASGLKESVPSQLSGRLFEALP